MIKSRISKLLMISIFSYPIAVMAANDADTIKIRARIEMAKPRNNNNFSIPPTYNISKAFSNGKGINIASAYFFKDKIASEFTIGVHTARLNNTLEVANAFNGTGTDLSNNKKSFFFPISLGAQYYPIKTSYLNLYTGLGVHYTFITNNKNARIDNSAGVFAQAGFDIYNSNTLTGVNFDVKKYWQKVNIRYKVPSVTNTPLKNKAKIDPWVFSTGIFYPF